MLSCFQAAVEQCIDPDCRRALKVREWGGACWGLEGSREQFSVGAAAAQQRAAAARAEGGSRLHCTAGTPADQQLWTAAPGHVHIIYSWVRAGQLLWGGAAAGLGMSPVAGIQVAVRNLTA